MPLSAGQTLSHYEILGPLGAGGMGEVYRARDTRLERDVAIKVLPEALADDEDRLRRFEREAKTLASLNHPNVAGIHGVDHDGQTYFLALELVPGEDLATRLARGPLPMDEAIDVCRQIAAGLEAAHEAGVIHRDLKPANVRVTPDGKVKVLDFGLAKPASPLASGGSSSARPDSFLVTEEGLVLGTPTYMSPEQARGKPVDRRTDIWAFGCVLYECLTDRRAFEGETISDVLASVLQDEPDLARLPAGTPALARELIERCLRKDPADRLRDVGDARVALAEMCGRTAPPRSSVASGAAPVGVAPTAGPRIARAAMLVAAGVALGALVVGAFLRGAGPAQEPGVALSVVMTLPEFGGPSGEFAANPTLSRDGRWIAYPGRDALYVRSLERVEDRAVPGSQGADGLFWSPGSDALGFSKDDRLWVWPLERAESRPIAALPRKSEFNGGAWMPDGQIYFCLNEADLFAVPAAGGTPELVLAREPNEVDFHVPAPLPGRDELLAVAHRRTGKQQLFVFSCAERRRVPVLEMDGLSTAAWSPEGYLLLSRNWTTQDLWAVRWSPEARRVDDEPFQVELDLQVPSVADDGSFICSDGGRGALYDMLLASRDKSLTLVPGGPFPGLYAPALSPDGTRIAYSGVTDDNRDIWVLDLERGTRQRLTSDPGNDDAPRWSADGREIFFERWIPGASSLYRVGATGDPPPAPVADYVTGAAPLPDGSALLGERDNEELGDSDIVRCALEPEAQPIPLLRSRFNEDQPAVSPDGRWLAYRSDETGRGEIFLYDLSGRGTKLQVSLDGGELPMWGPRGETLCFLRGGEWMEVRLTPGDDPAPKRPERIFTAADLGLAIGHDVAAFAGLGMSPDGERFLVIRRSAADPRSGILYFRRFQPAAR